MKISIKQYALSLYESLINKEAKDVEKIIKKFVDLLALNNNISRADAIINEFNKIWNEKEGIVEAEVISSNKLDNDVIEILKDFIKEKSGSKKIIITELQENDIKGGFIIKYEDKILDNSLKTRLSELKAKMIK